MNEASHTNNPLASTINSFALHKFFQRIPLNSPITTTKQPQVAPQLPRKPYLTRTRQMLLLSI